MASDEDTVWMQSLQSLIPPDEPGISVKKRKTGKRPVLPISSNIYVDLQTPTLSERNSLLSLTYIPWDQDKGTLHREQLVGRSISVLWKDGNYYTMSYLATGKTVMTKKLFPRRCVEKLTLNSFEWKLYPQVTSEGDTKLRAGDLLEFDHRDGRQYKAMVY